MLFQFIHPLQILHVVIISTIFTREEERKQEGLEALEKSVAIDKTNPDSHTSLASVLADLGRHLEAEEHYVIAVKLDPGGADYENNYGVYLGQRSNTISSFRLE